MLHRIKEHASGKSRSRFIPFHSHCSHPSSASCGFSPDVKALLLLFITSVGIFSEVQTCSESIMPHSVASVSGAATKAVLPTLKNGWFRPTAGSRFYTSYPRSNRYSSSMRQERNDLNVEI